MPMIEVDFETFKALTALRPSEDVSEGDVIRKLIGFPGSDSALASVWVSERVSFALGTKLRHRFRDGSFAEGLIVENGVQVNGKVFPGLSPAAAYGAGHQANGWQFWEVQRSSGEWVKADALRHAA